MNWDVDGSESELCFPHDADVGSLLVQGRFRFTYESGEVGDWEDCANFSRSDRTGEINKHMMSIDAFSETGWSKLSLEVKVFVEEPERHRLHVMHERDSEYHGQFGIHVVSASTTTHQSRTRLWSGGQHGVVGCELELELRSSEHAGELLLHPRTVLNEKLGSNVLDGKARRKASILGTGVPISIRIDKPPSFTGGGIKHLWTSFDGKYAEALTYLTVEDDGTVVCYWNDGFPELEKIINSTARKGPNAIRREAIFAPKRVELVKHLVLWASQNDHSDDTPTSLAERILQRVSKWSGKNQDELKEIHGGGGEMYVNTDGIVDLDRVLQHKFRVANAARASSELSIAQELNE